MSNAPRDWGPWPPTQDQVNAVVMRAARQLAPRIKHQPWAQDGVILVAEPLVASMLDYSFAGTEREVMVGNIRGVGASKGWQVYWNPAEDRGRLSSLGHYDHHS